MRTIKLLLLVFLALLAKGGFSLPLAASALWAADFEFRGAIEPTDDIADVAYPWIIPWNKHANS